MGSDADNVVPVHKVWLAGGGRRVFVRVIMPKVPREKLRIQVEEGETRVSGTSTQRIRYLAVVPMPDSTKIIADEEQCEVEFNDNTGELKLKLQVSSHAKRARVTNRDFQPVSDEDRAAMLQMGANALKVARHDSAQRLDKKKAKMLRRTTASLLKSFNTRGPEMSQIEMLERAEAQLLARLSTLIDGEVPTTLRGSWSAPPRERKKKGKLFPSLESQLDIASRIEKESNAKMEREAEKLDEAIDRERERDERREEKKKQKLLNKSRVIEEGARVRKRAFEEVDGDAVRKSRAASKTRVRFQV